MPVSKSALIIFLLLSVLSFGFIKYSEEGEEEPEELFDACTTVTVGRLASFDGSVMTSHTMDGHKDPTTTTIVPAQKHPASAMKTIHKKEIDSSAAMPLNKFVPAGEIPEAEYTFGYINTIIRCINEKQFAMGESTFGGRKELMSKKGLWEYEEFSKVLIERCATAREAIKLGGELAEKYGWADRGECFTFADPKEVWHFEIVGCGEGKTGAIWAARRVPDGHVSVNANASRIGEIDLNNHDYFMASDNVFQVARDSGWWNPADGPFRFNYAYDPGGRRSMSSRRREWRALSLMAPSLNLDPNGENFPFSVKPDTLVTLEKMRQIFQDYYEGTPFNPVKNITWVNKEGEYEISPLANPFMPYDMNKIFKINGGWNWLGERTIARWYTTYATIIQLRDWLPDEIGGVVWYAWDNVATSVYTPLYCSITDVPETFKVCGRKTGYSRKSAWWAFNRLSTLTAQRWGDMRHDVNNLWDPMQKELFGSQRDIDKKALELLKKNREEAIRFLTDYSVKHADEAVKKAWDLGDFLWTKYDEKF